jgi:hypothetical protein
VIGQNRRVDRAFFFCTRNHTMSDHITKCALITSHKKQIRPFRQAIVQDAAQPKLRRPTSVSGEQLYLTDRINGSFFNMAYLTTTSGLFDMQKIPSTFDSLADCVVERNRPTITQLACNSVRKSKCHGHESCSACSI